MDGNTRICIIGAGAAGLAAAHLLAKKGYRRVTVLEKDSQVGGKCCTIEHDGRTYELGATVQTLASTTVSEIMRDVGVSSTPVSGSVHVDLRRGACRKTRFYLPIGRWLSLGPSGLLLANEFRKHRRIFRPGFAGIDKELAEPFAGWASSKGIEPFAKAMSIVHTGFGYGYYEEVAAAYVLKYMTILRPFSTIVYPFREYQDTGYRGLWEKVAGRLDVRRSCPPSSITRGDTVTVRTRDDALEFDALILACPLDDALEVIDASPEEKELFSKIRYYDYHAFAGFTEDLPVARYGLIPGARPGRTMFWYRRWPDRNLCTFYSLGISSVGMSRTMDHEQMRANIEEDLARLGGKITGYYAERVWKYFPHVSPEEIAGGYYERLEALQGKNKTYYTGELLNFPTVETVAAYSKSIVDGHF